MTYELRVQPSGNLALLAGDELKICIAHVDNVETGIKIIAGFHNTEKINKAAEKFRDLFTEEFNKEKRIASIKNDRSGPGQTISSHSTDMDALMDRVVSEFEVWRCGDV